MLLRLGSCHLDVDSAPYTKRLDPLTSCYLTLDPWWDCTRNLLYTCSDKNFKGTVVNRTLPPLYGGLLTLSPLKHCFYLRFDVDRTIFSQCQTFHWEKPRLLFSDLFVLLGKVWKFIKNDWALTNGPFSRAVKKQLKHKNWKL